MTYIVYDKFIMLPEFCSRHEQNTYEIYCSCNMKLCNKCLCNHYHENLVYTPIKGIIENFHSEVNSNFKLISLIEKKTSRINKETSLFDNINNELRQISKSISSNIENKFYVTIDQLLNFKKSDYNQKILDAILNFYLKSVEENRVSINNMIYKTSAKLKNKNSTEKKFKEEIDNRQINLQQSGPHSQQVNPDKIISQEMNPKLSRIDTGEIDSQQIKQMEPQDMNIITKKVDSKNFITQQIDSTNSLFDDSIKPKHTKIIENIENIPPYEIHKESPTKFLFSQKYIVSERKRNFNVSSTNINTFNVTNKFNNSTITKNKTKINSTLLNNRPILYNFHFEDQNEFLNSANSKNSEKNKKSYVKNVCVTCREKFTILKELTKWRTRCDICIVNQDN